MEDKIFCKCRCGGEVKEYQKLYECKQCDSKVWKISFGHEFKETETKKLLRGDTITIKGLISSNNTFYDTKAQIQNGQLRLLFDEDTKSTVMFKCKCGGDVTKIKNGYKCHSCEQIIWEKFMNKILTFRQIKRLFKGESLTLNNLRSQRGNIFNAEIFYTHNELTLEYL